MKENSTSNFNLFPKEESSSYTLLKQKADIDNKKKDEIPKFNNNNSTSFNLLNSNNLSINSIRKNPEQNSMIPVQNSMTSTVLNVENGNSVFGEIINDYEKSFIKPLEPKLIQFLPEITFSNKIYKGETKTCNICKDIIKNGEKIMVLPCFHMFHSDCIKTHFKYNNSCPNCKFELNYENIKQSKFLFGNK